MSYDLSAPEEQYQEVRDIVIAWFAEKGLTVTKHRDWSDIAILPGLLCRQVQIYAPGELFGCSNNDELTMGDWAIYIPTYTTNPILLSDPDCFNKLEIAVVNEIKCLKSSKS